MASFTFDGIDELERFFGQLGALPDSVLDNMLEAEAPIVIAEQMQLAPRDTGSLAESISGFPTKTGSSGERYKFIYPKGRHHRITARRASSTLTKQLKQDQSRDVTNAEVGFTHEVGAPGRNIPASQWMKRANEKAADPALRAAVDVYDAWLQLLS
jgi:hypothetical protein